MQMPLHRMTLVAVVLAVATVPLAPLYCAGDDPAAMVCCAQQANECNRPAAPDDDCCRDVPRAGQTHSAEGRVEAVVVVPPLLALVDSHAVPSVGWETSAGPCFRWLGIPTDRPPPPLSVLRI
jgi:hypothetical protein